MIRPLDFLEHCITVSVKYSNTADVSVMNKSGNKFHDAFCSVRLGRGVRPGITVSGCALTHADVDFQNILCCNN